MIHLPTTDARQRFFISSSPIRGDVVQLHTSLRHVLDKKPYPQALQALLGEMLAAASLLIGTLKISGRLSLQLQGGNHGLHWAMAECDHTGAVRALADFGGDWNHAKNANDAFARLGGGVLFINIEQTTGDTYQGIVEKTADNLADCLVHYQKQSAQIPTIIHLASDGERAGGLLVQRLPQNPDDTENDPDLWARTALLASTVKSNELLSLPANELLYRLYHEEEVILPEATPLFFACTCSPEKSAGAVLQLGKTEALQALAESDSETIILDCGFCGNSYGFDLQVVNALFDETSSC